VKALWLMMLLVLPTLAWGGEKQDAEYRRLTQEMTKLAGRNAWAGVDRAYAQIVAIRGVEIERDVHMLGAQAAQARGSILDTFERLKAAEALAADEESMMWMARIYATYGIVDLMVLPAYKHEIVLTAEDLGFDPAARNTVEAARKALDESRVYRGLLPLGRYRLGHEQFDIIGGPLVSVVLKKPKEGDWIPPVSEAVVDAPVVITPPTKPDAPTPADPVAPPRHLLLASDNGIGDAAYSQAAEKVKLELFGIVDITTVEIFGRTTQVRVDIPPQSLEFLGITAAELGTEIQAQLELELPPGITGDNELTMDGEGFGPLDPLLGVLLDTPDGEQMRLDELARAWKSYSDGSTERGLAIKLTDDANQLAVREQIEEILTESESAVSLGLILQTRHP